MFFFNVFRYVTFRTASAFFTSLMVAFLLGPKLIQWLQDRQIGQNIRDDGPSSHLSKKGTPTMGGILFLFSTGLSTVIWARWDQKLVWFCLGLTLLFGAIGFLDDWLKVFKKDPQGLNVRMKLIWQFFFATSFSILLYFGMGHSTHLNVPFFKDFSPDLGILYVFFSVLVIVGCSNAVNLTDGLDGLATVPSLVAYLTYAIFAYVAGHLTIANYLQIVAIPGSSEVSIFAGAMVGGLLGFLWYNSYPAQLFMGDVGSLALGAGLGSIATVTKNEIILVLVGGIFVLETVSVMTQVVSFKLTGKRIFKMAPLHHHFELKGWAEPKVIVRFWIISIVLALAALSTLKIR